MDNNKVVIPDDAVLISRIDYEMLIRMSERFCIAKHIFAQLKDKTSEFGSYIDPAALECVLGDRVYRKRTNNIAEETENA